MVLIVLPEIQIVCCLDSDSYTSYGENLTQIIESVTVHPQIRRGILQLLEATQSFVYADLLEGLG